MSFFKQYAIRKKNVRGYWERHQKRWKKSGITQAEYCRKERIALSSFSNWRNRLAQVTPESIDFIKVQPSFQSETCNEGFIELVMPAVGILRIPETISPEFFRMILHTVKGIS